MLARLKKVAGTTLIGLAVLIVSVLYLGAHVKADAEPSIGGGSNASGSVDSYIPISGLQISGDSVDPIPVTLRIPSGNLSMTTTTGLTFSSSTSGTVLSFTGSKADINMH